MKNGPNFRNGENQATNVHSQSWYQQQRSEDGDGIWDRPLPQQRMYRTTQSETKNQSDGYGDNHAEPSFSQRLRGVVFNFNDEKGFGWIECKELQQLHGKHAFVHRDDFVADVWAGTHLQKISNGMQVAFRYKETKDKDGRLRIKAEDVKADEPDQVFTSSRKTRNSNSNECINSNQQAQATFARHFQDSLRINNERESTTKLDDFNATAQSSGKSLGSLMNEQNSSISHMGAFQTEHRLASDHHEPEAADPFLVENLSPPPPPPLPERFNRMASSSAQRQDQSPPPDAPPGADSGTKPRCKWCELGECWGCPRSKGKGRGRGPNLEPVEGCVAQSGNAYSIDHNFKPPPPCGPPPGWKERQIYGTGSQCLGSHTADICSNAQVPVGTVNKTALRMYTFGIENMDIELGQVCKYLPQSEQPDTDLVRAALQRANAGVGHVIVDARPFPDPDAGDLRGHIGSHPQILLRMAQHRNFRLWLSLVHQEIHNVLQSDSEVRVAVFCKKGRHRSVAAAWFLKHIGEKEGWNCSVSHLCASKWKYTCGGDCAECREDSSGGQDIRAQAFEKAWGYWKSF